MRRRVHSGTGASTRRRSPLASPQRQQAVRVALIELVQPMRIALIQVMQETCSFNPTPTTLADFASFGILEGPELLARSDSVGPIGGYVEGSPGRASPSRRCRSSAARHSRAAG